MCAYFRKNQEIVGIKGKWDQEKAKTIKQKAHRDSLKTNI